MSQSKELYESKRVWDQDLQLGQRNLIKAVVDFMPNEVRSILDVGCGDGKITSAIMHATGKDVIGLDSSEEALARCDFPTVRGNASRLPYGPDAFDMVMSTDTLEHLPSKIEDAAWQDLFRVARNWVAVAVPYRENLLDGAIRCQGCHMIYHVNWHMRAYDWRDLLKRAPEGWESESIILTGESWSAHHPLETEYRRKLLNEWAGWEEAICPYCGKKGASSTSPAALSGEPAVLLGKAIYEDLLVYPLDRQFSEVLCFFKRTGCSDSLKTVDLAIGEEFPTSHARISGQHAGDNLLPYPKVPHTVKGADGTLIIQFPLYGDVAGIRLYSNNPTENEIRILVEDGVGAVLDQGVNLALKCELHFKRPPQPGYYGLLVRLPFTNEVSEIELLGQAEVPRYCRYESLNGASYHRAVVGGRAIFLQVIEKLELDPRAVTLPFLGTTQQDLGAEQRLLSPSLVRQFMGRQISSAVAGDSYAHYFETIGSKFDELERRMDNLLRYAKALEMRIEQQEVGLKIDDETETTQLAEQSEINIKLSEYDLADGRPRIVMFCHDQHLDRRVVAQCQSLIETGCKVTLFALSYNATDEVGVTPEGIRLIRVGLLKVIPANDAYKKHIRRLQNLDISSGLWRELHPWGRRLWGLLFGVARRGSSVIYRTQLLARYRNFNLSDPLPFTSAFESAAADVEADLIQVHDLPTLEAGVNIANARGLPLVYDAHELYPEQRSFSSVQKRICSDAERRLIRRADLVFAVNESIATEMAKRYEIERPIAIWNAINRNSEFNSDIKYDLLREKTGIPSDKKIILFQGGYSRNRNLENLIAAMARVRNPSVVLVMLGFGNFGILLQRRAEKLGLLHKRVFFLEAVPQSELIRHSASADLGIIPYPHVDLNTYYCTPNKLFEFIQAELPILANDSPELRRFVQDTGFGMTHPMRTAAEIAVAIDTAFDYKDFTSWHSALRTKREKFEWTIQGEIYVEAVSKLIGRPSQATVSSRNEGHSYADA